LSRREVITAQDLAAALVSLFLVAGIVVLAGLGREIPPSLTMVLGSSTTWLFIRTAPVAGVYHYPEQAPRLEPPGTP